MRYVYVGSLLYVHVRTYCVTNTHAVYMYMYCVLIVMHDIVCIHAHLNIIKMLINAEMHCGRVWLLTKSLVRPVHKTGWQHRVIKTLKLHRPLL